MRHTLLHVLCLVVLLCGDAFVEATDTVNIFAVDYPIVAYIVASKNAITTYAIACTVGSDAKSCDFVQPYTLIEGPDTLKFQFTAQQESTTQDLTLACSLSGTTSMGCVATGLSDEAPSTQAITTTQTFTYTGATAAAFFSAVPVVTNSAALMTYNPGASTSSTKIGTTLPEKVASTSTSASVTSPIQLASSTSKSTAEPASTSASSLLNITQKSAASWKDFRYSGIFAVGGLMGMMLMMELF